MSLATPTAPSPTLVDYLKIVTPFLPPALVSSFALSQIESLAALLPPSGGIFECRLGEGATEAVDVSVSIRKGERLTDLFTRPEWAKIYQLHQLWIDPASAIRAALDEVGMEFDLDKPLAAVPIPSIFLVVKPLENPDAEAQATQQQTIASLVTQLLGQPLSEAMQENWHRCLAALPAGGRLNSLGLMLSRHSELVRLNLEGLSLEQIIPYLQTLGWQGQVASLQAALPLLQGADRVILALDVGARVMPRIGFECFLEKQPKQDEHRWASWLDQLVQANLCTPEKRDGLLQWPGFCRRKDYAGEWPQNLIASSGFLGARASSVFYRTISHLKIVCRPDSSLEAKGYLHFGHRWVSQSGEELKCWN